MYCNKLPRSHPSRRQARIVYSGSQGRQTRPRHQMGWLGCVWEVVLHRLWGFSVCSCAKPDIYVRYSVVVISEIVVVLVTVDVEIGVVVVVVIVLLRTVRKVLDQPKRGIGLR